jgi:hypothetical protein
MKNSKVAGTSQELKRLKFEGMKIFIVLILGLISGIARSQTGLMFPPLKGNSLDDKTIKVPFNNGKYSLIAIAYDKDAEDNLKGWLNPIYDSFIKKGEDGGAFDVAELYDVNFIFVPMIHGFKKVKNEFKNGTDKEYWPYIMDTEYEDVKKVQETLRVKDTKIPYFYILDKEGKIIEVQSGAFSEQKLSKLEDAVE